jgi:hypothetical protein
MQRFTIRPDSWFAWQMFPGYGGLPYCSPIYVTGFRALKAGRGLFRMQFINVFYAEGVQAMDKEMRVLSRQESYLVAALIDDLDKEPDRCVVISHIEGHPIAEPVSLRIPGLGWPFRPSILWGFDD